MPWACPALALPNDVLVWPCSKEKKLLKSLKFPKEYELKVDFKVVNWEVMKSWMAKRVTELLGLEDEVVIGYIYEQLEGKEVCCPDQHSHSYKRVSQENPCFPSAFMIFGALCRLSTQGSSRSTSLGSWKRTPACSSRCALFLAQFSAMPHTAV